MSIQGWVVIVITQTVLLKEISPASTRYERSQFAQTFEISTKRVNTTLIKLKSVDLKDKGVKHIL